MLSCHFEVILKQENENRNTEVGQIKKFEDIEVWQESMRLAVAVYQLLSDCRDYGFRDQMQRAAVSIPSNVAEGYERNTNKEYIQYLYIAKGSCAELRTQLYITMETGILDKSRATGFIDRTRKISAMLYKLIQVRKEKF